MVLSFNEQHFTDLLVANNNKWMLKNFWTNKFFSKHNKSLKNASNHFILIKWNI